jgi:hypothetical protein
LRNGIADDDKCQQSLLIGHAGQGDRRGKPRACNLDN